MFAQMANRLVLDYVGNQKTESPSMEFSPLAKKKEGAGAQAMARAASLKMDFVLLPS
jgi:hypothetical protein